MSSSTRNTCIAFAEFSRSISYFIFYRILGMISLFLVMASSLFLMIWYSLITASQFIDEYMEDIYKNINLPNFQKIIHSGMSCICQRVNSIFGRDIMYPPGVNIKEEPVEVIYENTDTNSDSEVEDVTEQFKAEQETNKKVIDLTQEEEEEIESESSDSTAPLGSTEQNNNEEDFTVIPDTNE